MWRVRIKVFWMFWWCEGSGRALFRPGTPAARVYQVSEEWPYGPGVGCVTCGEVAGSMDWCDVWGRGCVWG